MMSKLSLTYSIENLTDKKSQFNTFFTVKLPKRQQAPIANHCKITVKSLLSKTLIACSETPQQDSVDGWQITYKFSTLYCNVMALITEKYKKSKTFIFYHFML